jgi:hypothetical protein
MSSIAIVATRPEGSSVAVVWIAVVPIDRLNVVPAGCDSTTASEKKTWMGERSATFVAPGPGDTEATVGGCRSTTTVTGVDRAVPFESSTSATIACPPSGTTVVSQSKV